MDSIVTVVCSMLLALFQLLHFAVYFVCTNSTAVVLGTLCTIGAVTAIRWVWDFQHKLHPATKDTWKRIVKLFHEETAFCEDAPGVEVPVGNEDKDLYKDPECEDIKRVKSNRRIPYAVRVAHLAKAQVGLLRRSHANELVYGKICREEMIKHGVRPSHIAHIVPLAVAACFVPLDADILADSLMRCDKMKERHALLQRGFPSA